jgi:hypothetical protein
MEHKGLDTQSAKGKEAQQIEKLAKQIKERAKS